MPSIEPPVFVIGNPRSGTTLLRLMLTGHPGIAIPPEGGFLTAADMVKFARHAPTDTECHEAFQAAGDFVEQTTMSAAATGPVGEATP